MNSKKSVLRGNNSLSVQQVIEIQLLLIPSCRFCLIKSVSATLLFKLDVNGIFVEACANGDYQTVNTILESIKDFNIDVTDNLGRTALRLAVASEHMEVFFLSIIQFRFIKNIEILMKAEFSILIR